MRRLRRLGLVLLAIVGVMLLIVALIGMVVSRRPFPKTTGVLRITGLQQEVMVHRDAAGVPHLYAQNLDDLFLAQGYTHAQDRFWQMEWWRHIAMGRISEIAGDATLETDRFIRNLGWNRIAQTTADYYRTQEPDIWAILEAYSAGVNAYIEDNREQLSLNVTILGLVNEPWEIEPWQPEHTLGWATVMAWDLRGFGDMTDQQDLARMRESLGAEMMAELYPGYPPNRPIIAPTDRLQQNESAALWPAVSINWDAFERHQIGHIPPNGFALGGRVGDLGSNNWVIGGQHTASGRPLLANDPHLGVQMPSIWYLNGLHAPDLDVVGFTFAGVPGVVVGHNSHIAWGVTNLGADSQDLYLETLNPDNPNQYRFQDSWRDMTIIEEVIQVNGGAPVTLTVRQTVHGPLLNNVNAELTDAISVRWTAFEPTRLFKALVLLNQAQNYDQFREALRYWDTAPQNIVYADVEGNIAYQATGRYPIRDGWDGLAIVPGDGAFEWQGWIPYEEMPALVNPPEGYIVTANNAVVDANFPYFLSRYWDDGDRAQRIHALIQAAIASGQPLTTETMAAIQLDSYEMLVETYQPLLQGLSSPDAQVQAALERLRGWDGQLRRESVPGAIFELFFKFLVENSLADELGERAEDYLFFGDYQRILFHRLAGEPGAVWWDDVATEASETQADMLLRSVEDAVAWFQDNVGQDMNDWTWGAIHQVTFTSAPLGQSGVGPIESLVNRGPVPVDGGSSVVNANGWSWDEPATVTWHPSLRLIVDLADFDASLGIHPTGQSGHPFHRHYDDLITRWANGDYLPLLFNATAIEAAADRTLNLRPK